MKKSVWFFNGIILGTLFTLTIYLTIYGRNYEFNKYYIFLYIFGIIIFGLEFWILNNKKKEIGGIEE